MSATDAPKPASTTAAEVAAMLATDPKTLRRFLRASPKYRAVGQGKRYEFTPRDVASIKKDFPIWKASHTRSAKGEAKSGPVQGEARAARLDTALRATGLHLTQHAA